MGYFMYISTILSICLLTIGTAVLLNGIFSFKRIRSDLKKTNEVRLSFFVLIIGIFMTALLLVIEMILLVNSVEYGWHIFVGLFLLISTALVIAYSNCVITYEDDYFVHKSFWGIKRRFAYHDVTGLMIGKSSSVLYVGKHKVRMDEMASGASKFITTVKKNYKVDGVRKILPERKNKLFNDNIYNPGEFIFVFILISVIILGLGVTVFIGSSSPDYETRVNNYKTAAVIILPIIVLWSACIITSIYVMNRAEKYPRLIRLFVKPEYLKNTPNKIIHHKNHKNRRH